MHNTHAKNAIRYYVCIITLILLLFFSNDFGLIDIQKTAIITAVGIDREENEFILTSQIAIPQSSKQGKSTQSVQIVSRGATIADAFDEINAKTGWYPKLVFCHLIILGEKTTQQNVFDALDYFLRDEYLSDNCLLATCDGLAKNLLNTSALVDSTNSLAMEKVLSAHAQRVGFVLPTTLKNFSIGYFSDSRCCYMPLLKTEPQQEHLSSPPSSSDSNNTNSTENSSTTNDSSTSSSSNDSASAKSSSDEDKPVFSASETALFVDGKRIGKFSREETFAFSAANAHLQLAAYTLAQGDSVCTLSIRHNGAKTKLSIGQDNRACLHIDVSLRVGVLDVSKAQNLNDTKDASQTPRGIFEATEKKLEAEIQQVFDKCRLLNCDLFGVVERLEKQEKKQFMHIKNTALSGAILDVSVRIGNIR